MEIIITNLTKKLSGRTILSDISMTIPKGQVTGIAGVNGSGKSVLLKCIAGLMPYNHGWKSGDWQRNRAPSSYRRTH